MLDFNTVTAGTKFICIPSSSVPVRWGLCKHFSLLYLFGAAAWHNSNECWHHFC